MAISHLTESGICEMKFSKICALTGLLRSDGRGVDLISDALPFGRLWYGEPDAINAIGYAKFRSRSYDAVIRVYDKAGNVIETHEHAGDFKECEHSARKTKSRHTVKRDG
jgi:hypothetical protein